MMNTRTLARPYAKAIFELALGGNSLADWQDRLSRLSVAVQDPELKRLLQTPGVDQNKLSELLLEILGDSSDYSQQFVALLLDEKRAVLAPEILDLYNDYKAEHEAEIRAEVISTQALSGEDMTLIQSALEKRFNKKVTLESSVDETLLGGAVIRIGDFVIDGSGRGQLQKLDNILKGNALCH